MPRSRSARAISRRALFSFVFIACGCGFAVLGKEPRKTPTPKGEAGLGLKNIPLMVGHEAKGVVFPNFDPSGRLVGRFEAATADRLDDDHVRFTNLKMLTYNEHGQPDFNIAMAAGVLNLETKVITSDTRTTVKRADFEISGDTMHFDTATHEGAMHGHIHMSVYDQSRLGGQTPTPKPKS